MGLFLTDPKCIKQREIVNIPAWHEHGYLGEGLVIFHDDLGKTSHNDCCVDIIQTILPKAMVYSGSIASYVSNGKITECNITCNETGEYMPFEDFIVKYKVNQINNSTTGGKNNNDSPMAIYMREMINKYNLIGTGAFGNYSDTPTNRFQGAFIMVSGVTIRADGTYADYGVMGEACDFAMFMGYQFGTSFSAPFLNGIIGLIRSKYGMVTQEWVYEYLKEHCQDLGIAGKDPQFGWGLPILGEPIMEVKMTIGSKIMYVDGNPVTIDQEPFITSNDRTVAPVRYVAEPFGIEVLWDAKTKEITFRR